MEDIKNTLENYIKTYLERSIIGICISMDICEA